MNKATLLSEMIIEKR